MAKNKIGQTVTCGNLEGRSQCELVELSAEALGERAEMPVGFFQYRMIEYRKKEMILKKNSNFKES